MTSTNTHDLALAHTMLDLLAECVSTGRPTSTVYIDAKDVLIDAVEALEMRSSAGMELQALIVQRLEGHPLNSWTWAYVREGLKMLECVLD